MELKKILRESWAIALRDLKRESWIKQLIFIVIFAILIIVLGKSINQFFGSTYFNMDYTSFFSGGVIIYLLAMVSLGVGSDLILDSKGFIKTLLAAPISRISIFFGKLISLTITSSKTFLIVALLVMIYLKSIGFIPIISLLFACLATVLIFVGFGFLIAALIKETKTAQMIIGYGSVALFLFSGVFFPIQIFPKFFQYILYLNPLIYPIELMRFSLSGNSTIPLGILLLIMIILAILIPLLSVFIFDMRMRK